MEGCAVLFLYLGFLLWKKQQIQQGYLLKQGEQIMKLLLRILYNNKMAWIVFAVTLIISCIFFYLLPDQIPFILTMVLSIPMLLKSGYFFFLLCSLFFAVFQFKRSAAEFYRYTEIWKQHYYILHCCSCICHFISAVGNYNNQSVLINAVKFSLF